jgi:AraC-like DNA-binding protein
MTQLGKIEQLHNHAIVWIRSGFGNYEVDFKEYLFTEEVILYLEPGQYFRVTGGELKTETYPINEQAIQVSEYRYLFKHLISVGHITPHFLAKNDPLLPHDQSFLTKSLREWENLNPFHASRDELKTLFDLYDLVSKTLREGPTVVEILNHTHAKPIQVVKTVNQKLNLSVKDLIQNRKLLESQRELTFSSKSIKEIAYDLGFEDPAYFSRFFTSRKKVTPELFREFIGAQKENTFITDLLQLINTHYKEKHNTSFYADQLFMSPRNLSRKVDEGLNTTVKDIINKKILGEASRLLASGSSVKEIAGQLGFGEPQHFTNFYKLHTGIAPSAH